MWGLTVLREILTPHPGLRKRYVFVLVFACVFIYLFIYLYVLLIKKFQFSIAGLNGDLCKMI